MDNSIKQALGQFNIDENVTIQHINQNPNNMHTWEVGGRYFLKLFSTDYAKAERIVRLNTLLRRENVPAVHYHQTKTGNVCACIDGNYYTLADKLPGTPLPFPGRPQHWEDKVNAEKIVYIMGKNLAQLHLALKKLDGQVEVWDNNIMDELHGWILTEIRTHQIPIKQEVIDYCISFGDLYQRLPRQLIHRDPHGGNFLWVNDEITGILDFDLTQINSRVFDLHYAFGASEKDFDKWLRLRPYFFSGYHGVFPITKEEISAYPYMSVLIELLCAAYDSTRNDNLEEEINNVHWIYSIRGELEILGEHLTVKNI